MGIDAIPVVEIKNNGAWEHYPFKIKCPYTHYDDYCYFCNNTGEIEDFFPRDYDIFQILHETCNRGMPKDISNEAKSVIKDTDAQEYCSLQALEEKYEELKDEYMECTMHMDISRYDQYLKSGEFDCDYDIEPEGKKLITETMAKERMANNIPFDHDMLVEVLVKYPEINEDDYIWKVFIPELKKLREDDVRIIFGYY